MGEKELPAAEPNQPPTLVYHEGKLIGFYFARNKYWYRVFAYWKEGYLEEITSGISSHWVGNEKGMELAIKDYALGDGLKWSYEPEYLAKLSEKGVTGE